jgi:hypothetical protein
MDWRIARDIEKLARQSNLLIASVETCVSLHWSVTGEDFSRLCRKWQSECLCVDHIGNELHLHWTHRSVRRSAECQIWSVREFNSHDRVISIEANWIVFWDVWIGILRVRVNELEWTWHCTQFCETSQKNIPEGEWSNGRRYLIIDHRHLRLNRMQIVYSKDRDLIIQQVLDLKLPEWRWSDRTQTASIFLNGLTENNDFSWNNGRYRKRIGTSKNCSLFHHWELFVWLRRYHYHVSLTPVPNFFRGP